MHAEMTLISTLAAGLGLALILGFLAVRMKLPALVGYLLAGIMIGPFTPGFVADANIAAQCAEIGIMLLMFGVGLHFSIEDLLAVRKIALPGALAQIAAATLLGGIAAYFWDWSIPSALVFGLALSVASTVVLLRALEDLGAVSTQQGRIAIGWLVVEDLVMVLVLVLLPALGAVGENPASHAAAGGESLWKSLAFTLGKVGLFIALMLIVGKRLFPWLLWQVARTGSRELFTLSVIAAGVGIAYGSAHLFGISFAIGAFFAGMVLRESHLSYRAAEESLPLREAFSVLFFVSVGMLFNPRILIESPFKVFIVVFIIMFGKSIAAFLIVMAFRYPLQTALTVSASLAQIGEFSFILASLGVAQGLLPEEGQGLILAGAIFSIALNPVVFKAIAPLQAWLAKRLPAQNQQGTLADPLAHLPASIEPGQVTHHAVIVGCGRVGSHILESLLRDGVGVVVADTQREWVQGMRDRGIKAVVGDASQPEVMIQAHIVRAKTLILAIPDAFAARKMIEIARMLNPKVAIIARADHTGDADMLRRENVDAVFLSEHALADAMSREALAKMAV